MLKRILASLAAALLLAIPAQAEDMAVIDASEVSTAVITQPYFTVSCPAEGTVLMTITDEYGALCYERLENCVSGTFVSDAVYLPMQEGNTRYTVEVTSDAGTWQLGVVRTLAYLRGQHASAGTYSFASAAGRPSGERIMLIAGTDGTRSFPLIANNAWQVGTVTCEVADGQLLVSTELAEGVTGSEPRIEVALSAREIAGLTDAGSGILCAGAGEPVDLGDAGAVAVWVGMTVSFEPALCGNAPQDGPEDQALLWRRMCDAAR